MTTPACTCPTKLDSQGQIVRAYLDANCPVHAQPAGAKHCPACGNPIVQTPEIARRMAEEQE